MLLNKHPTMHRTPPPKTNDYLAQNANSAKVKKSSLNKPINQDLPLHVIVHV